MKPRGSIPATPWRGRPRLASWPPFTTGGQPKRPQGMRCISTRTAATHGTRLVLHRGISVTRTGQ